MKETRLVEEVKVYLLVMQPMTGNAENTSLEAASFEKQKLIDWHNEQKVELYNDEGPDNFGDGSKCYRKQFRKGGPLEWMNPIDTPYFSPGTWGHGIHEQWIEEENINRNILFID